MKFSEYTKELKLLSGGTIENWQIYQFKSFHHPRCKYDWGRSQIYKFDRGSVERGFELWMEIYEIVINLVMENISLARVIDVVPIYESGEDWFIQAKPLFDGGYSTGHYEEYLKYQEHRPVEEIVEDLHHMRTVVSEFIANNLKNSQKELILTIIFQKTFF